MKRNTWKINPISTTYQYYILKANFDRETFEEIKQYYCSTSSSGALNQSWGFEGFNRFHFKCQSFSSFLHEIIICKIPTTPFRKVNYFLYRSLFFKRFLNSAFIFRVHNLVIRQVGKKLLWPGRKLQFPFHLNFLTVIIIYLSIVLAVYLVFFSFHTQLIK